MGGVSLASSRDTSNGPAWTDCCLAAYELESEWEQPVLVSLTFAGKATKPELVLVAKSYNLDAASGGLRLLGCASVSMSSGQHMSLEGALLRLLFELDADLYRRDVGICPPAEAGPGAR